MAEKISKEEVDHIAKLSRLDLSAEEEERFSEQLSSILGYVDQLSEIKTEDVEPTSNITGLSNIYRDDEVESSGITYKDIAKNAPEFEGGSFVVPGVFE